MREKIQTPWGRAQTKELITSWLYFVSTPGHGGVKLDREHNAMIPKKYRRLGGWYEEDCEMLIPLYFLHEKIESERVYGAEWLKLDKEKFYQSMIRWFGE